MQNTKTFYCLLIGLVVFLGANQAAAQHNGYYLNRSDWSSPKGGDLNISGFAFRDLNRNGVYDLADRPMANVAFELVRPDGSIVFNRSNINGFANFLMSALGEKSDVKKPGPYQYRTIIPPDWSLTTGNALQSTVFKMMPGSPADIVSSTPASPVGLAPNLKIDGKVQSTNPIAVKAIAPNGEQKHVSVTADGSFTLAATPGLWLIRISDGLKQMERSVSVDTVPVRLATLRFETFQPESAVNRQIISFDDLLRVISIKEIPAEYGNLGWQNFVATHNLMYGGEGYVNSTTSGEFVAYNSSGHPVSIYRDKPFDFIGGNFGVAWSKAEGETLTIKGWRNSQLVYEDTFSLSTLGPVYFHADYRAVTRVEFATGHYWQFVTDDILIGYHE